MSRRASGGRRKEVEEMRMRKEWGEGQELYSVLWLEVGTCSLWVGPDTGAPAKCPLLRE